MPSLIQGYEYDIFISYRQKDNKGDHWVTEFVKALKTELDSAFKEDISIYFDSNPHDGLLETHNVNKSLEGKLKCLIFIPILSQTYCDPKSFAWRDEFCAFNKLAQNDPFGRDIKLKSGNVASRILPVQIHELEAEDRTLVEKELGSVLRSIEFIYQTAGVVRPLLPNEEDAKGNLKHTFYRDQVNKVVRGIKELISGMQTPAAAVKLTPAAPSEISSSARRKFSLAAAAILTVGILGYAMIYFTGIGNNLFREPDKSIAVLPFENMNKDSTQDYFSNGIAEDILNHLVKIADLKVKSRTSTLQYKGTTKTMSEIGDELNVSNVLEGSVRRVGDKVRIVVQLIDTESDTHLWSETYDRDLKDVLSLQSEISLEIAKALQARLTLSEKTNIQKQVSQSITAYDYLLKARDVRNRSNGERRDVETALQLVNQAIQLDPGFAQAYAYKGRLWFITRDFGVSLKTWQDSAMYFSSKAIALDPSAPHGYLVQGPVYRFLGKQKEAREAFYRAYQLAPNDPDVLQRYGLHLLMTEGDETGALLVLKALEAQYSQKDPEYYYRYGNLYLTIGEVTTAEELFQKYKSLSPGSTGPYWSLSNLYKETGQFGKAILEIEQAEKINPTDQFIIDELAWLHYKNNNLEKAAKYWLKMQEIETGLDDSTQILPFRHRLGMVYLKMGRKKDADALFAEDFKKYSEIASGQRGLSTWDGSGGIFYTLAVDHAYFGNDAKAVQYLDSAFQREVYWFYGYRNDPMFSNLRKREDFKKVMKKVNDKESFLKRAFSKALNQAEASKELRRLLEK
ncbi:MAG: tetratricopeptide repeat protein [Bacteroidota bacterium]